MSKALYTTGGLRFWTEDEVLFRECCISDLSYALQTCLLGLNRAWMFERIDGPIITPVSSLSGEYSDQEVWYQQRKLGGEDVCLRPETTPSSYVYAKRKMMETRPPLCIWQAGKSFRQERNDGASPSKLRFYEFWQCEFQCIYSKDTKANYSDEVIEQMSRCISHLVGAETRCVESDRLPSYSTRTIDVETLYNGRWTEMCSISNRVDFEGYNVLEVAVGLDRVVSAAFSNRTR